MICMLSVCRWFGRHPGQVNIGHVTTSYLAGMMAYARSSLHIAAGSITTHLRVRRKNVLMMIVTSFLAFESPSQRG